MSEISYTLVRSRRRTISIQVKETGDIVVRAPTRTPLQEIEYFVVQHREWALRQQSAALAKINSKPTHSYAAGEEFLFLGDIHLLRFSGAVKVVGINENNELILPVKYIPKADKAILKWYKQQALQLFAERLDVFSTQHQIPYSELKLINARTRWGSCSHDGRIHLNWKLIMAPLSVADYVIAHELAHVVEHNHSDRFWALVEKLYPQYKEYRKWLKVNGHLLSL